MRCDSWRARGWMDGAMVASSCSIDGHAASFPFGIEAQQHKVEIPAVDSCGELDMRHSQTCLTTWFAAVLSERLHLQGSGHKIYYHPLRKPRF